jgi:Zn-dependent protease with chaperone function
MNNKGDIMQRILPLLSALLLSACVNVVATQPIGIVAPAPGSAPERQIATFAAVVERVEPVAEAICRERSRGVNCDLQIVVDPRPELPPNAFQTVDRRGRPIVGFTLALIGEARNADEIAFVLGHEASHHIAGHIAKREQTALAGALVAAVLAQGAGADPEAIRAAQDLGAEVGARTYSREFELEADAVGAEIALRAGFDPIRGAAFFDRLPDPGDQFLGTHPPNSQRKAIVARTVAALQAGGTAR